MHGLEASGAAGFRVRAAGRLVVDIDVGGELCEFFGERASGLAAAVGGPAEPEGAVGLVEEDLEDAVPRERLWYDLAETLVEEVDLFYTHEGRAAPVGPACLVAFVIVMRRQVDDGVYEAQDHALRGPIDDDVDCHVVGVDGDLICVLPGRAGALIAQLAANTRQSRIPHAVDDRRER